MATLEMLSKEEYLRKLAAEHFAVDPGMSTIVRLVSKTESARDEPLKVLEVNADTFEDGIVPIPFSVREEGSIQTPPVIIVEVSPAEYERIKSGSLPLPNQWELGEVLERSKSA